MTTTSYPAPFHKRILEAIRRIRNEPEVGRFFRWRKNRTYINLLELCLCTPQEHGGHKEKAVWTTWSGHTAAEMSVCLGNIGHGPLGMELVPDPAKLIDKSNVWVLPEGFEAGPGSQPEKTLLETLA